jgi:hypothetical protein
MYVYDIISLSSSSNENVSTEGVQKNKTHILYSKHCFRKSYRLCNNMQNYGTAGQSTDENIMFRRKYVLCMPDS